MADTSRLMDALAQLAPRLDELVAYKQNNPPGGGSTDDGHTQEQIDAATDTVNRMLSVIP